jgi:antitoxin (DNA-binding transcriptional repressor) of toxin-antitoxin stability system
MKAVNVAELKNRLSHYLRLVRRGQVLLVKDRDQVVARIEPAGASDAAGGSDEERLASLERRGILRRGRGALTPTIYANRPRVRADVVAALLRERDESR